MNIKTMKLGMLVAAYACCALAQAATFTADQEADLPDLIPGNGFCNVFPQPGPGPCTLRAAIIEANALAGADTINLLAGKTYTLNAAGTGEDTGYTGDLDITDNLTIQFFASGVTPVVSADKIDRVFDVLSGNVTLLGFEIREGNATSTGSTSGGGILVRSGAGRVNLSFMRVVANTAELGGGMYNSGHDTHVGGSVFENDFFLGDAASTPSGSAIRNRGNLEITHSTFSNNRGILPELPPSMPQAFTTIANAIDSSQQGAGTGGLRIVNSIFFYNDGNAINIDDGVLELSSVTIAANSVLGLHMSDGSLLMHNSMIARNGFGDCLIGGAVSTDTNRYNLDSDDSCGLAGGSSNRAGVNPQLTPPADHGGPRLAIWPAPNSIAIDHGHPLFVANGCENDDATFQDRPVDFDGDGAALCDIGAIELQHDVIFFDPFDRL